MASSSPFRVVEVDRPNSVSLPSTDHILNFTVTSELEPNSIILEALLDCSARHFSKGPAHPFVLNWSGGEASYSKGFEGDDSVWSVKISLNCPMNCPPALPSGPPPSFNGLEKSLNEQVASCLLQSGLRKAVEVAFVMNGSVLPRKGGGSHEPMEEAVPFSSPPSLEKTLTVSLPPSLVQFLPSKPSIIASKSGDVQVTGLEVPPGVTLIVGSGYHGKSTLLRALMSGCYNKVAGDGREFVVCDGFGVRSEDGRGVSRLDLSPFIKDLPTSGGERMTGEEVRS